MFLVIQSLLMLLVGFILLIWSGDKLVESSIQWARRCQVPPSLIALTIISAGTSAPELFTSFLAGLKGSGDIAMGNVMGSNTFNILAVGGLSMILQPGGQIRSSFPSWVALMGATGMLFYFLLDFHLWRLEALVFLTSLAAFIIFSFFYQRKGVKEELGSSPLGERSFFWILLPFLFSLVGLVLGAELALEGGVALGKWWGLSERVIAITLISGGTGLPELVASVVAAYRGHSGMAIANVIGSNMFNTLAIPGLTAIAFPLEVDARFMSFDFYVMAIATFLLLLLFGLKKPGPKRVLGLGMCLAYGGYVAALLH